MYIDEKDLIDGELPIKVRSEIVSSIFMGYQMVIQLLKDHPWLQSDYGKNNYGELRNSAVSFCISQMISRNKFAINAKCVSNSRRNYNYIQMKTENALINISQVKHPNALPRYSDFRFENSFLNLQTEFSFLSDEVKIINGYETADSNYYLIITHGCDLNMPAFVHIGIPEPGVNSWKYQYNLLRDPKVIQQPDEEEIKEILPKFKEQLKKGVQGDGQKF